MRTANKKNYQKPLISVGCDAEFAAAGIDSALRPTLKDNSEKSF
jgi:hypothetical protein